MGDVQLHLAVRPNRKEMEMPQLRQMGVKDTIITGPLSGEPALAKAANGPAELRLPDAVDPKEREQAGEALAVRITTLSPLPLP